MASYQRCMLLSIAAITWVACNLIGGCEGETSLSDACKLAMDPHFCVTSLRTAMGGDSSDLTKISATAVELTNKEVHRVERKLGASDPRLKICVELLANTAAELDEKESELDGINSHNFEKVISDVQKGLDNVFGSTVGDCEFKLKESGNVELIPIVQDATWNLELLTSDAQSVVYYLSQQGLPPPS